MRSSAPRSSTRSLDAAQRDDRPVTVVLALRADFYGACAAHPRLAARCSATITCSSGRCAGRAAPRDRAPARAARASSSSPSSSTALVEDVADSAGALPLLSTALLELWQRRDGRAMRLAAYERTGGVDGAVARLAEQRLRASLTPRRPARRAPHSLRLAGAGEGDTAVRRRVPLAELDLGDDARPRRVLGVLADSRLVTVGEGDGRGRARGAAARVAATARLARGGRRGAAPAPHGSRWPRATGKPAGATPGELYRGARLASALDWALEHGDVLNRLEREFLERAALAGERAAERGRRANRRLRALLAGRRAARW